MKKTREVAPGIGVDSTSGFGKPVLAGTQVEVATVLAELASGVPRESLKDTLGVTNQGMLAALAYATDIVAQEPSSRDDNLREIAPGITADGRVRFGKAVIKGTRVDAATVLGHLAAGDSIDAVADAYHLQREGVLAALRYAHQIIAGEIVSAV